MRVCLLLRDRRTLGRHGKPQQYPKLQRAPPYDEKNRRDRKRQFGSGC